MDPLSKYDIALSGLEPGRYSLDFQVDDAFFAAFQESVIHKGVVDLHVDLHYGDDILVLNMAFNGRIELVCDRCLGPFTQPVAFRKELLVRLKDQDEESDEEEVLILSRETQRLPLAAHLYDYLSLQVPYRKLHPEVDGKSTCNPETLKALESLRQGHGPVDDGRWDALKKIRLSDR